MPVISSNLRLVLAAVAVLSTFAALFAGSLLVLLVFCGVAVLGFTISIDWSKPLPSAAATAASGIPVALASLAVLDAVDSTVNGQIVFTVILVGFFITACFAWAVAGSTFRTTEKRRWWIALGASAVVVVMVVPSVFISSEEPRIMAPGPYVSTPLLDV